MTQAVGQSRGWLGRGLLVAGVLAALALFALPNVVGAPPAGGARIDIALKHGGVIGGGTLTFGGVEHGLSVGGLGLAGVSEEPVEARGDVYNLRRPDDIQGAYVDRGGRRVGGLWLTKDDGVEIRLSSPSDSVALSLTGDAVYIMLDMPFD